MELYSAIKKNEILSCGGKWMELKNITFSELSQAPKAKAAWFLSYVEYRPNTDASRIMKNR
jgi:hypothetical protein